ncbi:uncharacterized protein, partial [Littorina saxatilis]|uniref:uncharacterized protein n=1 Tax=Littorina saxatilis TaxID=31220 RepID=UPI0038B66268
MILDGLTAYIRALLPLMEQREVPSVENGVNGLFNQIVQTCYEQLQAAPCLDAKHAIFLELSKLLNAAFELLKGKQSMHFTALGILNRIIDMCIVHRNYETGSVVRNNEAATPTAATFSPSTSTHFGGSSSCSGAGGTGVSGGVSGGGGGGGGGGGVIGGAADSRTGATPKRKDRDKEGEGHSQGHGQGHSHHAKHHGGGGGGSEAQPSNQAPLHRSQSSCLGRIPSLSRRRASLAVPHSDAQAPDGHKSGSGGSGSSGSGGGGSGVSAEDAQDPSNGVNGVAGGVCVNRTPLEILLSIDPGQIMSVLHNSITMHKRIIGTRQKCTPGVRWHHCTHHCLQILSARVLTVMCHSVHVQHKIVSAGHLKPLVEALDPNHDP